MDDPQFAVLVADARMLSELVRVIAQEKQDPETFIAQMKVDVLAWADRQYPDWAGAVRDAFEMRVDDVLGAAQNRSVGG
ncbi:hypothetical protein [Bordetella flabilis]|uniref:Uncharacterized protein n=1 Tax=Bordetella flabilis TaxID=463014 RepID=A0A193GAF2_9BORD|nr:hypothetical protein [Bordetella flabilis]ANN76977.1 hypothetical protein BAU07_07505 [Bordetella flabilis]